MACRVSLKAGIFGLLKVISGRQTIQGKLKKKFKQIFLKIGPAT
jgi:hypothetical protein